MKKRLVLMAMAGVALAGCVNDVADVAQKEQKDVKIAFDTPVLYNNAESRANVFGEISSETVEGNYSYPKTENFVIYAVSHEGDFAGWASAAAAAAPFNGQAISYDSSVDGWAPKDEKQDYYYWETGKKMSFAATSPADLAVDACTRKYDAAGLSITNFAVNADAAKQYDLLFSTRSVNNTSANMAHGAEYYSGIPIQFQHALSSIRFSLRNTSQAVVKLTGITLEGLKYKGNFTEGITEVADDYTKYVRGENVTPAWAVEDDLITAPYVAFTGDIPFSYEARYVSSILGDAGSTGTEHDLLLMPQALTDESVVTVNYTINGKANSKTVCLMGLNSVKNVDTENEVKTPITEWEIGKRYTYRLFYSDATAKKDRIFFSPSTDNWQDVDVIIVAL